MLRLARTGEVIARAPRVAASTWARAVGVIGAPFRGYDALVIPRCRSVHTWFLRVGLDLVFVDAEGRVRGTVPGARPWRWFLGPRGARTVIELPAGALCGIAVAMGDPVEGLPPPRMKFRITKGKRVGHEFEVRSAEVRLGRRSDNDIVLDDESASGHHAVFAPDRGGVLVRDCGSVNGITVNGKLTKSAPLSPGDLVAVGLTEIEVLKDEEEPRASTRVAGVPAGGKGKAKGGGSPVKAVLAAVLVVAVVLVGWLVSQKKLKVQTGIVPTARGTDAKGPTLADDFFRLRYEKVQASADNVFRYEMRIENDSIAIAVDDLRQSRKLRRSKSILPKQAGDIRDAIVDQQVFSLPPRIEGKSAGVHDSWRLAVVMRGEARDIEILNRIPPENFKRLCAILESFGEAELGMVALSMSGDELKKRANESFLRARKLYDERFVNAENLFNSIKAYTETIWYLDSIEPKPAIFAEAIHGKQTASDELDQQIEDHRFRAARSIQLQEWRKARDELAAVLQKLPDVADRRNQEARVRLLDVEKRLAPR